MRRIRGIGVGSAARITVASSIAAFAALAAAVGLALMPACSTRHSLPEGAELIPQDTTFAISVDVPAILNSELYKRYQANESAFGHNRLNFYRFAQATGLDPSKDIKRLLFMARAGDQALQEMSAVVVGSFDGRKVHDYLAGSGMPIRKVGSVDIFEFIVIDGRCRFCLAVIDASTAAFGDGETLEKIARIKSGTDPALAEDSGAGRLLRRVGRGAEAWGVLRAGDLRNGLSELLQRVSADSAALKALGPIQVAAFSFDTAEPMRVIVELTTTTDQDAMMVADVIKGAESLGRLAIKEARPELSRVMSDFSVEADTGVVRVSASIPSSDLEMVTRVLGIDWRRMGLVNPPATREDAQSPSASGTPPSSSPDDQPRHR